MVGTVQPHSDFNTDSDCEKLREAFKGAGTDEDAIIDIVCHRSVDQRVELCKKYKTMYGKDLIDDIKDETSYHFKEVLVSLLLPTPKFLARVCKKAIEGPGTSEGALINVLVGATKEELEAIKDAYQTMTESHEKTKLEKDVISDTSGSLQRVLVALLQGHREEGPADHELAIKDAEELFKAGSARWGTDESAFNKIIVSRSPAHLKRTFNEYKNVADGENIESAIKSEMSGAVKDTFLAIVGIIKDPAKYFAEQIHKSMKGLGTNDDKLIRLIVWRSEIDLVEIKECFKIVTKQKTLEDYIRDDCSGYYKKALLALC